MEVQEERDIEMGRKNIQRSNPPKPPKFDEKNVNMHIQETKQMPSRINLKIFTLRHIIIKLLKGKHTKKSF